MSETEEKRSIGLLAAGALIGLAMAAFGVLDSGADSGGLSGDVVASVNGAPIRRADFERLVAGLESDTRQPADAEVRQRVLDRMIDEELLVQRGLDLGFARADRKVRADLVSGVIAAVAADAEEEEASQRELADFYRENADFFTQPGRLRVRQIFLRVPDPTAPQPIAERAAEAARRLRAGEDFQSVRSALGDEEVSRLPDTLLPATKLREYVGPTALRSAMMLGDGEVSDPVRSGMGYHVLWRVASEPDRTPELADIEAQVRSEWTRRAGDRALRSYLDDLRADADVAVTEELH